MKYSKKTAFDKPVAISSKAAYAHYRRSTREIRESIRIKDPKLYTDIINTFWKKVAEGMLEKDGGVYVKGVGYFANWMSPLKKRFFTFNNGKLTTSYNNHTNNHSYHPMFFPDVEYGYPFRAFRMDYAFKRNIKQGLRINLFKGKKYKNYRSSLKYLNRKSR